MIDNITIDQLRVFIATVEEGSFSAAGRKLHKVQSAVSYGIANLEENLGVQLFDRSKRAPLLTPEGLSLLNKARTVLNQMELLHKHAQSLQNTPETELSIAVDSFYPLDALIQCCSDFRFIFPNIVLHIYTQTPGETERSVVNEECMLGVVSSTVSSEDLLHQKMLGRVTLSLVVAQGHPLLKHSKKIDVEHLSAHTQIVLTAPSNASPQSSKENISNHIWKVNELHTMLALIKSGLGWGKLPAHMIREELFRGELESLTPEGWKHLPKEQTLLVVHRQDRPLGSAEIWLLEQLQQNLKKYDR